MRNRRPEPTVETLRPVVKDLRVQRSIADVGAAFRAYHDAKARTFDAQSKAMTWPPGTRWLWRGVVWLRRTRELKARRMLLAIRENRAARIADTGHHRRARRDDFSKATKGDNDD